MTSFINPGYPTEHRGARRLELLTDAATRLGQQFKGGKGLVALFAEATHGWTGRVQAGLQQWLEHARERAQDERVWAVAQSDPRLMAEIQAARIRAENEALAFNQPVPSWSFIGTVRNDCEW